MRRAVLLSILTIGCYGSSEVEGPRLDDLRLALGPSKNMTIARNNSVRVTGSLASSSGATLVNSVPITLTSRDPARVAVDSGFWVRGAMTTPGVYVVATATYGDRSYIDSLLVVISDPVTVR
jgi:hypothetical protein